MANRGGNDGLLECGVNWRSTISEAITRGVQGACSDVPTFTENWSGTLAAEYLLTVRIAVAIRDLNNDHGGIGFPLKVFIEERTRDFIRKCIPIWPVIKDVAYRKRIYRAVKRKGKIDIGVTYDSHHGPGSVAACVIEIKGFDPAVKEIRKDLIRNANFMKVAELTGRQEMFSSLWCCMKVMLSVPQARLQTSTALGRFTEAKCGASDRGLRGLEVDYDVSLPENTSMSGASHRRA